jgi:hypothetical protein
MTSTGSVVTCAISTVRVAADSSSRGLWSRTGPPRAAPYLRGTVRRMLPAVPPLCACQVAAARAAADVLTSHLADHIRWAGVVIAVIGAFEAAPAGTARILQGLRQAGRWLRRKVAKLVRYLRRPPAFISAAGSSTMKGKALLGEAETGVPWDPAASVEDRLTSLHERDEQLAQQIVKTDARSLDRTSALRRELQQATESIRGDHARLVDRLGLAEERAATGDARAIWVVGAGIVLTGIPGELALWPPLGVAAVVAALALAVWVGTVVVSLRRTS